MRTGKVRMEFRDLAFLGEDSRKAGRWAAAAARQDRLWNFIDVFYFNQGDENSGYVTPTRSWPRSTPRRASTRPRRRPTRARRRPTPRSTRPTRSPSASACSSTPSFLVGKRGGGLAKVEAGPTDLAKLKAAIDSQLKGST